MTRIVVTSDLHLGITSATTLGRLASSIADEVPDLTVLAGDLGEELHRIVECLELFTGLPGDVAVLAGNHDLWAHESYSSKDLWEKLVPEAVRDAGMLWLEDAMWRRDGFAVAGSLAWYDYSAADPTIPSYPAEYFTKMKGLFNNDANYIRWPWSDQEFADRLGAGLCERLGRLEADPAIESVLLITHVPLFEEQMRRYPNDFHWGFSNAYFGNMTLGRQVLKMSKVQAVVSGHTHSEIMGKVMRPGLPPLPVSVLGSDYRAPVYMVLDSEALADGRTMRG